MSSDSTGRRCSNCVLCLVPGEYITCGAVEADEDDADLMDGIADDFAEECIDYLSEPPRSK